MMPQMRAGLSFDQAGADGEQLTGALPLFVKPGGG